MIKKLVRQMLTAQIFSALAVSLCLLIDIVVIGRFLGDEAMSAYQYANPLLLSIGAIGTLLSAGVQVACGKSLGSGSQRETSAGYSSAVTVAAAVSLLFMAVVLVFTPFLARAMGAGRMKVDDQLDYSVGFVLQVRIGDRVEADTPLCVLHARSEEDADRAEAAVRAAVSIGREACGRVPNFFAIVTKDGIRRTEAEV